MAEPADQRLATVTIRGHWRDVVDAWHDAGRDADAAACAALAVSAGLWTDPRRRPAELVDGLVARPLHDVAGSPAARAVQDHAPAIAAEAGAIAATGIDGDTLRRLTLCADGEWTTADAPLLQGAAGAAQSATVLVLPPGAGTGRRCGGSNAVLHLVLPVSCPAGLTIDLAGAVLRCAPQRCVLFDGSFEHEIRNAAADGPPAVLLIVEIPHPGLGAAAGAAMFAPAARLARTLRSTGLHAVRTGPAGPVLHPGPDLAGRITTYLADAGIRDVVLDDRADGPARGSGAPARPDLALPAVRRSYSALIDTLHAAGRTADARRCAQLAVDQGVWVHPMQRDRDHVAGLAARPLHDPGDLWFVARLEERAAVIVDEVRRVLDTPGDPLRHTLEDGWLLAAGTWRQAYLFRDGRWCDDVAAHFPQTRAILAEIPEISTFSPGSVLVSRLSAGTHITPHCGSTNAVLRIHLGIRVPERASIRVADRTVRWAEGRCLVFDDSFEHEVHHDGAGDRVVLIIDTAHPDLAATATPRLLARRPTARSRAVAFMREHGLAGLSIREGAVRATPAEPVRTVLARQLAALGVTGAALDDDGIALLP
jgi:Aspartyl/Asparaginyl beta-hydroxylase